jgi:hypothetical protein
VPVPGDRAASSARHPGESRGLARTVRPRPATNTVA